MDGLLYKASFDNITVGAAVCSIWEIIAAAGVPVLLRYCRIDAKPTITSGIAQDERMQLRILRISSTGTGGTGVLPPPTTPVTQSPPPAPSTGW